MTTFANITLSARDGSDFSDLDADLDAEQPAQPVQTDPKAFAAFYGDHQAPAGVICPKCKGSGRYRVGSHSRFSTVRDLGPCFKCNGSGSVTEAVAKAHNTRETNKAQKQRQETEQRTAWIDAHRDVIQWIYDNLPRNDFAGSLVSQYEQKGTLSPGQITAVRNAIKRRAGRQAERAKTDVAVAPAGLDLSHVPAGHYAVPDGETRLKVLIEKPVNEPDEPTKWHGWIFVSDGAEYGQRRKYGRQEPGKSYSGLIEKELRSIAADPKAAAIAYGKLTGRCAICHRKLENEESVERGIGPICADKQGW